MASFADKIDSVDTKKKTVDPMISQALEEDDQLREAVELRKGQIEDKYQKSQDSVEKKRAIEMLINSLGKLGAARAGAKSGVDMSGIDPGVVDREPELGRIEARRASEMGELSSTRQRLGDLVQARKKGAAAALGAAEAEKTRKLERGEDMTAAKGMQTDKFKHEKALKLMDIEAKQKAIGPKLSPAQQAIDREFGKEYVDFVVKGGKSEAERNFKELEQVSKALGKTDMATGPIVGLPPKFARDILTPKGSALQDVVGSVVQKNLREILGGQFAEREGVQLIERAYNPRQPEAENKARVDRLVNQIKEAYNAKVEAARYYEQNGTLEGFTGNLYNSANDFLKDEGDKAKASPADEAAKKFVDDNPNDPRSESIRKKLKAKGVL